MEIDRKTISAMDEFRQGFADNVTDVLTGAESIGDAIKNMADLVTQQIARIIAQKAAAAIFGEPGTSGAGSSGGGTLASIFGALFGGGRAAGGPVSAGRLYEVGEGNRSEMFMAGGKQFLIPGNNGRVTPGAPGGGGQTNNITVNVNGAVDKRTAQQLSTDIARKVALAGRAS